MICCGESGFFFFKPKTAYEMRISYWSSDVCSSDLLDSAEVYDRLGSPEGELALAQAVVYLACAAKSNAVYSAYKAARKYAQDHGSAPVPLHLRNAPTKLMKQLGHGKAYRYAHDETHGYAAGEHYFPAGKGPDRKSVEYGRWVS